MNGSVDTKPAEAMVQAVAAAHYQKEVDAANSARERAQRSFTIAAAVATTLLATGAFTGFADQTELVRGTGMLALVAWIVAAIAFTRAIATPIQRVDTTGRREAREFVDAALNAARDERDEVDRRLGTAQASAIVAMALTLAALGSALVADPSRTDASLLLSDDGSVTVRTACPLLGPGPLQAEIDLATLERETVTVYFAAGECRREEATLQLARRDVLGVRS